MALTLRAWRERNHKTQVWLSVATGIPQSTISRYERKEGKPDRRNAIKIEKATNGEVTVESWDADDENAGEAAGGVAA
jgi:transcriptional regulator with XRE-family HTH domain